MKRLLFILLLPFCFVRTQASVNGGFGLDAFNRAVSATTRGNIAFSPFSFEVDSVIFSEAVDAFSRSKLAETMGILNGLELAYAPLYETLSHASNTNYSFRSARGFCLPNEHKTLTTYRQWLQKTFSAEAFSNGMREGAQCWFRARLDGAMENFVIKSDSANGNFYSYFDLVAAQFFWQDPFPTNNTTHITFHVDERNDMNCQAMSDVRLADVWRRKNYTAIRLRLSSDSYFFVLLPFGNVTVRDLRSELNSSTIHDFLGGFKSSIDPDFQRGRVSVTIPIIDIIFESDLKLAFDYFRFPTHGMERMEKGIRPRYLRQYVRFRLDEKGTDNSLVAETPAEKVEKLSVDMKPVVLDKPFLFFIYHEPTATIPIVGQFMGQ